MEGYIVFLFDLYIYMCVCVCVFLIYTFIQIDYFSYVNFTSNLENDSER
jgi:hypothetical protein